MHLKNSQAIIIAILSGLLSAFLYFYPNLSLFVSLPIFISAFRGGRLASIFSGLLAISVLSFLIPTTDLVLAIFGIYIPVLLVSYLASQSRDLYHLTQMKSMGISAQFIESAFIKNNIKSSGSSNKTPKTSHYIWYPISSILLWLALYLGLATLITTSIIAKIDPHYWETLIGQSTQATTELLKTKGSLPDFSNADLEKIQQIQKSLSKFIIFSYSSINYFLNIIINLMLGLWITSYMGGNNIIKRPLESWTTTLRIPLVGRLIFILAIGACFLPLQDNIYSFLTAIIGAFSCGFILSGLSILHHSLRNKEWKLPALFGFYAMFFILLNFGVSILASTGSSITLIIVVLIIFLLGLVGFFSKNSKSLTLSS